MNVTIPKSSIFRPAVRLFTADYNDPTVGKYNWNSAANRDRLVLEINPENLYFISVMNFSTTVPESAFLENIETAPAVRFVVKANKESLYGGSYPVAKYLVNNEIAAFFWTKQASDQLLASFTGILGQNASLLPFSDIRAVVAVNIFEITDHDFIDGFFHAAKHGVEVSNVFIPPELDRRI